MNLLSVSGNNETLTLVISLTMLVAVTVWIIYLLKTRVRTSEFRFMNKNKTNVAPVETPEVELEEDRTPEKFEYTLVQPIEKGKVYDVDFKSLEKTSTIEFGAVTTKMLDLSATMKSLKINGQPFVIKSTEEGVENLPTKAGDTGSFEGVINHNGIEINVSVKNATYYKGNLRLKTSRTSPSIVTLTYPVGSVEYFNLELVYETEDYKHHDHFYAKAF